MNKNEFWPDPDNKAPMEGLSQVWYLKNFITKRNTKVWDYTYYDDIEGPERFESNVLYHFPFIWDKLIIGKFCAISKDVKFIMNWANHKMSWFSTYPFQIFNSWWKKVTPKKSEFPYKWNTVIENDVWIWYGSTIMPWVKIGSWSIIATKSVVTKDVAPYSIVGGNPAKLIRLRFDKKIISSLLNISWWDWSAEKITKNLESIVGNNIKNLENSVE